MQVWEVQIIDTETEKITRSWSNDFHSDSEHFLLTEYRNNYTELYFNGTSDKTNEIFIDIYNSLIELGNNVDIAGYIYSPIALNMLFKHGYGLFARGPKNVLNIYEKALVKQDKNQLYF